MEEKETFCRLCIKNNDELQDIFSSESTKKEIKNKIYRFLSLNISEDDTTSRSICLKCLKIIDEFHSFYENVQENQKRLKISVKNETSPYGESMIIKPEIYIPVQSADEMDDELENAFTEKISPDETANNILELLPTEKSNKLGTTLNNEAEEDNTFPFYNCTIGDKDLIAENPFADAVQDEQRSDFQEESIIAPSSPSTSTRITAKPSRKGKQQKSHVRLKKRKRLNSSRNKLKEESSNNEKTDESESEIPTIKKSSGKKRKKHADIDLEDIGELSSYDIPKKNITFIKDGKFIIRGKELSRIIQKFYSMKCEECPQNDEKSGKVYDSIESLFKHYETAHSHEGYVLCCGKKLIRHRAISFHLARHFQPDAFTCSVCGRQYYNPDSLRAHMPMHRPDKLPFACELCPKRFLYSTTLDNHKLSHLSEETRESHKCETCSKSFASQKRLIRHIRHMHEKTNTKPAVCHICGKELTKSHLNYHLEHTHGDHDKTQEKRVQCTVCLSNIKESYLREHMLRMHSGKTFQCTECDYSCTNRKYLRNHKRIRHSNEKPHVCEICGSSFKVKTWLRRHMVQHTGEARYKCDFCDKRFMDSGNMYKHRKRMHPVEYAYVKNQTSS